MASDRLPDEAEVVALEDETNVKFWCSRWSVSEIELKAAVRHARASDAPTVALALGKEAP